MNETGLVQSGDTRGESLDQSGALFGVGSIEGGREVRAVDALHRDQPSPRGVDAERERPRDRQALRVERVQGAPLA